MQTSRFQLGLVATLAVGLGFSLSSSEAVGYPAGAAVSMGLNPVFSVGGHVSGTDSRSLSTLASAEQAVVITDVMLTTSDAWSGCFGNSRVSLLDGPDTVASFSVGVSRDSRQYTNWSPQFVGSFQSGIRFDPSVVPTLTIEYLSGSDCNGGMNVEYTISGYYAQP
jgi:hypothetical protein